MEPLLRAARRKHGRHLLDVWLSILAVVHAGNGTAPVDLHVLAEAAACTDDQARAALLLFSGTRFQWLEVVAGDPAVDGHLTLNVVGWEQRFNVRGRQRMAEYRQRLKAQAEPGLALDMDAQDVEVVDAELVDDDDVVIRQGHVIKIPWDDLIAHWNQQVAAQGAIECMGAGKLLRKYLRARWCEEWGHTDEQRWATFERLCDLATRSPWLLGRVRARDGGVFRASLIWICKPENCEKVLAGVYVRDQAGRLSALASFAAGAQAPQAPGQADPQAQAQPLL